MLLGAHENVLQKLPSPLKISPDLIFRQLLSLTVAVTSGLQSFKRNGSCLCILFSCKPKVIICSIYLSHYYSLIRTEIYIPRTPLYPSLFNQLLLRLFYWYFIILGTFCEIEVNECHSAPCLNDGRCLDMINEYKCQCAYGWTGDRCEVKK